METNLKGRGYLLKKLILFLLCFTVLAVGVTYGCIQYTLHEPSSGSVAVETGIDLNGFYDENDLLITESREEIKGDFGETYLTYPQIDGLKDTEVQSVVNDRIRGEAERLKNKYAELGTNIQYLSYNIHGSFANVLSLGLFSGDDAMHYEQVYLNFNLNDGSMLRLEDLFGAQADLNRIVHSAFYDALTRSNLGNLYWETVSSPDEYELYKTVKAYLNGERKFAFSPSEIYLYYGDYAASVPMTDFAEDIVVYSKYLGEESLYVNDDVGGNGMFTCARIPGGYRKREFGFAEERFWYDIAASEPYFDQSIPTDVQERVIAFSDEVYRDLLDEVEAIRRQAEAHPDKAYVLLARPELILYCASEQIVNEWIYIPSCATEINWNYSFYEMDAESFESQYRQDLIEMYRSNTYTMFYSGLDRVIGNDVQVTKKNRVELYNYKTGEPILTIDEIFADGYDYRDAIRRQAKYDMAGYYGYTLETAEAALQGARFELEGSGIRVYIPEWGNEQNLYYAFSQFPRSALKIFE